MNSENNRVITKITPDRDKWGYAVCFGTIICFIAGIGHINSFGLIYNDFIIETNSTAKSLTIAHGVFAIMLAIGGLILNALSKTYLLRFGGLIGAVIYITGAFLTILISNTNQLFLTFGVLQGLGFGMIVPVCYSELNYYFVSKRTSVMSSIKAIQGLIIMWYPLLLKMILSVYGFRGTLGILSGISLHMIPGILTIKTRKRKITTNKLKDDLEKSDKAEENIDLLMNNKKYEATANNKIVQITMEILEIFNVKVLKDLVYCNICFGQSFVNFSDLTFFILQPMLLFQYGFDKSQVATCISIGAGADVTGRFVLAIVSGLYTVNTRLLFYVATFFTLIARIVILQVTQFLWITIITGVLGMLRACLHVTTPLVISNQVSHEDFPGAYALFMLTAGIINVMLSPLIGGLKDYCENYLPSFIALSVCCLPCLLFWPLEYIFLQKKVVTVEVTT